MPYHRSTILVYLGIWGTLSFDFCTMSLFLLLLLLLLLPGDSLGLFTFQKGLATSEVERILELSSIEQQRESGKTCHRTTSLRIGVVFRGFVRKCSCMCDTVSRLLLVSHFKNCRETKQTFVYSMDRNVARYSKWSTSSQSAVLYSMLFLILLERTGTARASPSAFYWFFV